jgi:hypothetical protein
MYSTNNPEWQDRMHVWKGFDPISYENPTWNQCPTGGIVCPGGLFNDVTFYPSEVSVGDLGLMISNTAYSLQIEWRADIQTAAPEMLFEIEDTRFGVTETDGCRLYSYTKSSSYFKSEPGRTEIRLGTISGVGYNDIVYTRVRYEFPGWTVPAKPARGGERDWRPVEVIRSNDSDRTR